MTTKIVVVLFILGSMASLAWYGAGAPPPRKHTFSPTQRRAFGLLALACWVALLILGNTIL
jgi:hypothetical protein